MKKIILITILLTLLLSSCGRILQKDYIDESESVIQTATQSPTSTTILPPQPSKTDSSIEELTREMVIGSWNDLPFWATGESDCHNFYEDGRYLFIFNTMDELLQLGRRAGFLGKWQIENNVIIVTIEAQIIKEGGVIKYNTNNLGYYIDGGIPKVEILPPFPYQPYEDVYNPTIIKYEINDLQYSRPTEEESDPHLPEELPMNFSMTIGKSRFWKMEMLIPLEEDS